MVAIQIVAGTSYLNNGVNFAPFIIYRKKEETFNLITNLVGFMLDDI